MGVCSGSVMLAVLQKHAQRFGGEAEVEPGATKMFAVGLAVKKFGVADQEDFAEDKNE